MTKFDFPSVKDGEEIPLTLVGEPHLVKNANWVMDKPTVKILFDYPLDHPVVFEFTTAPGKRSCTVGDFAGFVLDGYRRIYEVEWKYVLNEDGTRYSIENLSGPYGVWGHGIGDLSLNGAEKGDDGVWKLDICSDGIFFGTGFPTGPERIAWMKRTKLL
jgi:hypothetical protein